MLDLTKHTVLKTALVCEVTVLQGVVLKVLPLLIWDSSELAWDTVIGISESFATNESSDCEFMR